jgi:hypothetical protein
MNTTACAAHCAKALLYVCIVANATNACTHTHTLSLHAKHYSMCSESCGWHDKGNVDNSAVTVKYAYIGNGVDCPNATDCMYAANTEKSPNGNPGADGM